jgi:Phage MuF-C-terminal domain
MNQPQLPQNPSIENFAALVDAIVASSLAGHTVAKEQLGQLGATPELLRQLGLPELPLAIKGKTIEKVVMDHGIPKGMLKRLHKIVADPQAVYRAVAPHPSGVVVLSFEATGLGSVVISIAANQQVGRGHWMNLVTSMYAKEHAAAFERWKANGQLIWTKP